MNSLSCFLWLSIFFLLSINTLISAHSLFHHIYHHTGPRTNVTKHISFSNFHFNLNPSLIHDVKLLGSAKISQTSGSIQISDASPYRAGRAIYASPIRLLEPITRSPASFNTTFSFQFNSTTNAPVSGGLAFVIVPDEFTIGRPGPWLGMLNDACDTYCKLFAIEFDNSYDQEFGDPNDDHVGINLGGVVSRKTANALDAGVSLRDNFVHRAWISYDSHKKWIQIYLGLADNPNPTQPILSASIDLSPFLNEYMFVGFSASTGSATQTHNVLSWNFSSTLQSYLRVPSTKTCHRNVVHQVSKYSGANKSNHPPSSFMIFVAIVGLFTLALFMLYCHNNRSESSVAIIVPEKKQRPMLPSKPYRLNILQTYTATKRFSNMEILCSDSSGILYRGILPNGSRVAVKRFATQLRRNGSLFHSNRVLNKVKGITKISHPNLATIRGWCSDHGETIIVYDYFQNGSIDKWLFGVGVLPWTRRFMVVKDVSESLSYLHSKQLAHGNLKTSSVFLDVDYRAVVGDYGFTFFASESGMNEEVSGTRGDVLGFGMLLLEIVAGKRTVESSRGDVLGFAWDMHERGEKEKVVDERMGSGVNMEQAIWVLELGLTCTINEKLTMDEVLEFLNMTKPIPKLPSYRPAISSQI